MILLIFRQFADISGRGKQLYVFLESMIIKFRFVTVLYTEVNQLTNVEQNNIDMKRFNKIYSNHLNAKNITCLTLYCIICDAE